MRANTGKSLQLDANGVTGTTLALTAAGVATLQGTSVALIGNQSTLSQFDASGNALVYNRIYPGNAGTQTTGYFAWDGSSLRAIGADFYVTSTYFRVGNSGSSGTGALPNPTNWIQVKDSAGNIRRIPTFANNNTWAA